MAQWIFSALLAIRFPIANSFMRWRESLNGSQERGRRTYADNLRASPFYDGLSINTTFMQIHFDEYELCGCFRVKIAASQESYLNLI